MKAEPLKNKECFHKMINPKIKDIYFQKQDVESAVKYLKRYVRFDVFSQIDTTENYDRLMDKIDEAFEDVTEKKKKR